MANTKCKECGCMCKQCKNIEQNHNDMHLYVEIENLRQRLVEQDNHIVNMENQFLKQANKFPNGELASLKEEIVTWQDKYTRLQDAHKRIQQVNHNLEDKLLKIVDKCETEKGAFTKDITTLSHRLAEANYNVHRLTQDNEKYRNDVNLAIQLLQCKPSNYIGQKFDSLAPEVQVKVRTYVTQKSKGNEEISSEVRSITVPIATFPPTAMVYNLAKQTLDKQDNISEDDLQPPVDVVPATIMAKVLEDREKERIFTRHCITCTCNRSVLKIDSETQTIPEQENCRPINIKSKGINRLDLSDSLKKSTTKISEPYSIAIDDNVPTAQYFTHDLLTLDMNIDNLKLSSLNNGNGKNALNLKNSSKQRVNATNFTLEVTSKNNSVETNPKEKNQMNLNDQAKIDIINERVWKNSWINSSEASAQRNQSQAVINVINEREWRNNMSSAVNSGTNSTETVIPQSDRVEERPELALSSSVSSSLSSPDPSSFSSEARPFKRANNQNTEQSPAYQTVLYTSGSSRPNTALVHTMKTTPRTVDVNNETTEGLMTTTRVAQWVSDSLTHESKLDEPSDRPLLS